MADKLGARIGDRIAQINTRAKLDMLDRSTGLIAKTGMHLQEEFFRLTGSEVRRTVGPMWSDIAKLDGAPKWLKDTSEFLAAGKGQWATLFAGAATGAVLSGGLGDLITNTMAPAIRPALAADPNAVLSAAEAATIATMGIYVPFDLAREAAYTAVDGDRYAAMVEARRSVLALTEIVELFRRGKVMRGEAENLLQRMGFSPKQFDLALSLADRYVSGELAAAMYNRGIIDEGEAISLGGQDGYTAPQMQQLMEMGGEPPDLTSIIVAWQRGIITESQVDRAIKQGPIRFEWIPVVKALRWNPLSPSEAADAVNQGHMDLSDAQREAELSGVRPEHFKVIVDNAGLPPGPQEALDWVNRGLITESQFRTAFLESRVKNKYIDLYLASRRTILTMAEIRSLYAKGAMTREQALQRLAMRGYSAEDAGIILDGASKEKTATARDLTTGQILDLYELRALTAAETVAYLMAHGYEQDEALQYIELSDLKRIAKYFNAAVTKVRSSYVARRISYSDAVSALDALEVPPDARDDYINLWEIERAVSTKTLTTAQIVAAAGKDLITPDDALERLMGQGYAREDATVILALRGVEL